MRRELTQSDVTQLGQTQKLAPKVTDFIGRKGFQHTQEVRADGVVEDVVTWKPNVRGKKTKAALEVEEAMQPFTEADTHRQMGLQSRVEREVMTDADGGTRYVAAEQAESAAVRNGWHHKIRVRGRVVAKIDRAGRYVRVGE